MSPDAFNFIRRITVGSALLTAILAVAETPRRRKEEPRPTVDELIGAHTESVLLTRTAPSGPRLIEVSQWEDLVKASRYMGRPILRLDDPTRGPDQPLFYVPDGPQSYFYDFQKKPIDTSRSGAYLLPPRSEAPEVSEPTVPSVPQPPEPMTPPPTREETIPKPAPRPEATAVLPLSGEVSIPTDEVVEQYLGPEVREPEGSYAATDQARVEGDIREMIHHILEVLRHLPPTNPQVGRGTLHVQRAMDLLRRGRYGSAQIEVNRAARVLLEDQPA